MHRCHIVTRFFSVLLIFTLVVTQSGCVTKPPSMDLHDKLLNQRIALVPARDNAVLSLNVFAGSKPQGALKGAGQGIAAMLGSGSGGSCSGEICGAVLLLYLAFAVVVGGTVGAIQGSMAAPSAKTTSGIEALISKNLGEFVAHIDLTQRVFSQSRKVAGLSLDLVASEGEDSEVTAEELHRLKEQGYGKVLTVKIERFDFVGGKGDDPSLGLYLEALTRIVDTGSRTEEYRREFHSFGSVRRYSEWLKMDSEMLSVELNGYLEKLAEEIVNGLFLSYELPIDSGSWVFPGAHDYGCCWICPINPPLEIDYFPAVNQRWPQVFSRPQLEWQNFPDEHQQARFQEKTGYRATNVLYDLRVWEMVDARKGGLVYERYGLPTTIHRLEHRLQPGKRYLWSVRACFDLDERAACTPWAFSLVPAEKDACESTIINPENYYHFLVR